MPRVYLTPEQKLAHRAATLKRSREKAKLKKLRASKVNTVVTECWCEFTTYNVPLCRDWTYREIRKHLCHTFSVPDGLIICHFDDGREPIVGLDPNLFEECAYILVEPKYAPTA